MHEASQNSKNCVLRRGSKTPPIQKAQVLSKGAITAIGGPNLPQNAYFCFIVEMVPFYCLPPNQPFPERNKNKIRHRYVNISFKKKRTECLMGVNFFHMPMDRMLNSIFTCRDEDVYQSWVCTCR